jgi:ADP-heptose:LPS heptosyltransferase
MPGSLFIRLKGMGDIVHVIPCLEQYRQEHPDEDVVFLCQKPFGDIIPDRLRIKVWQISPRAGWPETAHWIRKIRRHQFERVVDLFGNPRTALLTLLSGASRRLGFSYRIRRWAYNQHFLPRDANRHLMRLFEEFFGAFSLIHTPVTPPILDLDPEDVRWAKKWASENLPDFVLGVNPHTTYPSKAWPREHFSDFIRLWYQRTGRAVLVFYGPGEEATARAIQQALPVGAAVIPPPLSVRRFLALLAQVSLFVTADTGPMNLAWAMQVPTIALFGPTTRRAVAPHGDQHLVLHHPTLPCLECHRETCDDGRCMSELTPDVVYRRMVETYFPNGFPA